MEKMPSTNKVAENFLCKTFARPEANFFKIRGGLVLPTFEHAKSIEKSDHPKRGSRHCLFNHQTFKYFLPGLISCLINIYSDNLLNDIHV